MKFNFTSLSNLVHVTEFLRINTLRRIIFPRSAQVHFELPINPN
ncbi:MAG: hypothetical protein ACTS46_01550 [Candidatus Hodgkinia cicadicola]